MLGAEGKDHARAAVKAFEAAYGLKFPKAVAKITDDLDGLFYDHPAGHWVHLRTKGPGWRAAGLAMAFKLIQAAQDHWRMVNAPHLVALVRAGARVERGVLIERPKPAAA